MSELVMDFGLAGTSQQGNSPQIFSHASKVENRTKNFPRELASMFLREC